MTRFDPQGSFPGRNWAKGLLASLLALMPLGVVMGQATMGEMRRQATRSELEKAAKSAESASMATTDSKLRDKYRIDALSIRSRLENGDFVPGDRILLLVAGDTTLSDTFTVRGDRMLPLPNIPPISLQGVLDSELEPFLTKELQRYIKQVAVEATPLVRISMMGFPQSSFYTVPVDQAITDVITAAGGWGSPTMAQEKTVVRRGGRVIMDAKSTAEAIRLGKTVGDMAIRDGDELYVPDRQSGFSWAKVFSGISAAGGLIWLIFRVA